MNYDIKLIHNYEGEGRIELHRLALLATQFKNIARKALLLELFGYSKVAMPPGLSEHLSIFLTQTRGSDGETIFSLDAAGFQHIPRQLDLFQEKTSLQNLTPMALVIRTFAAALHDTEDRNRIDEPILIELVKFKHFFKNKNERIMLANRSSTPAIVLSPEKINEIEQLYKTLPSPQKTIVAGFIDEMKFTREQVILTTLDHHKIVVLVAKSDFSRLKEFFGRPVILEGIAHFKSGGQLSFIKMERFGDANENTLKLFSKKPHKTTTQRQIALQLRQEKEANPLSNIIGQWPGDESLEELLHMLKTLDGP